MLALINSDAMNLVFNLVSTRFSDLEVENSLFSMLCYLIIDKKIYESGFSQN